MGYLQNIFDKLQKLKDLKQEQFDHSSICIEWLQAHPAADIYLDRILECLDVDLTDTVAETDSFSYIFMFLENHSINDLFIYKDTGLPIIFDEEVITPDSTSYSIFEL